MAVSYVVRYDIAKMDNILDMLPCIWECDSCGFHSMYFCRYPFEYLDIHTLSIGTLSMEIVEQCSNAVLGRIKCCTASFICSQVQIISTNVAGLACPVPYTFVPIMFSLEISLRLHWPVAVTVVKKSTTGIVLAIAPVATTPLLVSVLVHLVWWR